MNWILTIEAKDMETLVIPGVTDLQAGAIAWVVWPKTLGSFIVTATRLTNAQFDAIAAIVRLGTNDTYLRIGMDVTITLEVGD